jgi:hypothetical protein
MSIMLTEWIVIADLCINNQEEEVGQGEQNQVHTDQCP